MDESELFEIDRGYNEALAWSKDALRQLQKPYLKLENVNMTDVNKWNKPQLASLLCRSLHYMGELMDYVKSSRNVATAAQHRLIESQKQVISVQAELSDCKTELLDTLKETVKSSVVDSVKAEFQTYSSIVENSQPREQVISSETLETVVKHVVKEEDRSRNIVVFGLTEDNDSELTDVVSEVFQNIGQKPKIVEACRIGSKSNSGAAVARPVKVKLSSSIVVDQLVANARNLRKVSKFKTVFVCPDRSPEQRQTQRDLVNEMKERASKETGKIFFIKAGKIHCKDKTVV